MGLNFFQKKESGLFLILLITVFAFCCSGNILRQGQEIKQFHAFGITRSLVENHFSILHTFVPCEDVRNHSYPRPWAEEPPLFHGFAALLQGIGLTDPAWPNFFISVATCVAAWYLVYFLYPGPQSAHAILLVIPLATPVFLRYFSEHLPEGLAVFFFLVGVISYLRNAIFSAICFVMLAVTAKAFAIFPAITFFSWVFIFSPEVKNRVKGAIAYLLTLAIVAAPFVVWAWILEKNQIPNPFNFTAPLENRHSGAWSVLWSVELWDRLFTFVGTKGLGWPLFLAFICTLYGTLGKVRTLDRFHGAFLFWALGFIPFWIFVRAASIIHDHYVLQYFYPMAFLATERVLALRDVNLKTVVLGLSLAVGITNPIIWRSRVRGDASPPSHCGQEEHSLRRFTLPK